MEPADHPVYHFDVFLSFRGPDTRQGFTDVLFDTMARAGIRAFRDDDEIAVGDEIEKILEAINNSRICVPIFSKTFAQSKWCLREVQRMTDLGKDIAPIFYEVTPDDVMLKTPTYEGFMTEHRRKEIRKEIVNKWEDALKAAAGSKGMQMCNTRFTNFCKEFVEQILRKLGPREKFNYVGDAIGLDDQVEAIMNLIKMESTKDVRYIGIYGMGGIGKTTLAKVIYNKCLVGFDCHSFLDGVRESSERHGLRHLEMELINSLDRYSKRGLNSFMIKHSFCAKKVLIVLDDVDAPEQVEKLAGRPCWFAPGSRIIVTSRDMDVLAKCRALRREDIRHYQMYTLGDTDALRLFSGCAFGQDSPPNDFDKLSNEAISTCGGLPLALVVIGRLLVNKEKRVWEGVVAKSKRIPVKEVKERLKISYDKLDTVEQQLFLDIACFSVCMDKTKACYMWEACKFYPGCGLAILQSLSLIQIRYNDKIYMHDQLRDLGKDIVRAESMQPRKRTRVWDYDEALTVILSKKRKTNVQGICLDKPCKVVLTKKELAAFDNIRFLRLDGVELRGDLGRSFPELRWLSLKSCSTFEACNLTPSKLVTLDLTESPVTENWGGWSFLQRARELKVLNLSRCSKLKKTPCFSKSVILEQLTLSGCSNLVTIDRSIGNLERLTHLDLRGCERLCGLPEEIGTMVKLNTLSLSGCLTLEKLPCLSIRKLTSLVVLDLSFTSISKLPESVGELFQLKRLDLKHSQVTELPSSIGSLESLVELDLSYTEMIELPPSIGRLVKLNKLNMKKCHGLKTLPESIGELKALVELDLSNSGISELPCSVGRLANLQSMGLEGCMLLRALPSSIGQMPLLRQLSLWSCDKLCELPELPVSLNEFLVRSESPQILDMHSVAKLVNLRSLELHANVTGLASDLSRLRHLGQLALDCRNLDYPLQLPSSLTWLTLDNVNSETSLPRISNLKLLRGLILQYWSDDVVGFESLEINELGANHDMLDITVERCSEDVVRGICQLKNLRVLIIGECEFTISPMLDVSALTDLSSLTLSKCKGLANIIGLGNLKCLERLILEGCSSLKGIEEKMVLELKRLTHFVVLDCPLLYDMTC